MPVIGETNEARQGTLALRDIADKISDLIEAKSEHGHCDWTFTVHRDQDGFITTITATPKP